MLRPSGPRRDRPVADRPAVGVRQLNLAATQKAEPAMVEIVAVKIVHDHLCAGRAHERIEEPVFEEQRHAHARELIAVVLAHRSFLCDGVIGLTDARVEQKRDVAEDIG